MRRLTRFDIGDAECLVGRHKRSIQAIAVRLRTLVVDCDGVLFAW